MKINRAEQTLSATEKCVMQKGFHNTTVQEIASMAAISTGLIYRYFTGKSEIIAALVSNVVERLQQKIQADNILEDDSPRLTLFARDKVNDDAWDSIALMLAISAESSRNGHIQHIISHAHLTLQDYAFSHFRALNTNARDS
ncbi:MAG: TetR/AcrR family transcriptional regulator [Sodalis sp. (in: enterobacteria)]|uniref:TetR/AcrR family transcriptional regulator n=1 Tax=Sodalis sp. (in: enterobacteria) TaxID=1898979 RepID=UPI003F2A1AC8